MKRAVFLWTGLILISPLVHAFPRVELCSLGSFQFSHLSVASPDLLASPIHSPRLACSLGIGFRFPFSQKFSIETDILYKAKKSELTRFSGVDWNDTYYHLQCLAISLLAHLQFPLSKVQVFAILGAEGSWIFKSLIEDKKNDLIIEPIPGLKSYDLQAVAGAGIRYKRISIEFRYEYGLLNISKDRESGLSIKSRGFEFLIAFRLF
jgi:hypothetical protein